MTGINFNFGADPLLGSRDFSSQMSTIEQMQAELEQKKAAILQARQQMEQQQQNQQAPQSRTPIWDEIDSICAGMSEKEFAIVSGNDEFRESQDHIAAIIQQAQLEMLRPIIESSQQGRDALDRHLTLVKRLKKTASKEVDDELNDFKEYREKYAHMTYEDYSKMKREQSKPKKK
jgi:hypothetical protein